MHMQRESKTAKIKRNSNDLGIRIKDKLVCEKRISKRNLRKCLLICQNFVAWQLTKYW